MKRDERHRQKYQNLKPITCQKWNVHCYKMRNLLATQLWHNAVHSKQGWSQNRCDSCHATGDWHTGWAKVLQWVKLWSKWVSSI
jgi:hypothetical protein